MNVLFLTLSAMEDVSQRGIYTDLVGELNNRGVRVYVVSPRERRENLPTEIERMGNITILKVKTGNITQTKSLIEKGISTFAIEGQYLRAIKKYFSHIHFDMILYSTPPITFAKIIKYFKTNKNSMTYLMLKDIFPQNAVDMGAIKKGSIIWRYFRKKEIELYKYSDIIGCMSKGNMDYLSRNNDFISKDKVEIFPNAIKPIKQEKEEKDRSLLRKFNVPGDAVLFIYGGNLGRPQGIDFLLEVIDNFQRIEHGYLLIVGSGTEFYRIKAHVINKRPKQVSLLEKLPKDDYDRLVASADVGLIFLDRRFTIPNFPSRLTSYMENALPILAATDTTTDLKDVLGEAGCGLWCESGDLETFIKYAQLLSNDPELRERMGLNSRRYLEENYDITKTVDILLKHLTGDAMDV